MAVREQMTAGEPPRRARRESADPLRLRKPGVDPFRGVGQGARRERLYRREDMETLKARKDLRRNPIQAAERGLSWGLPVLESG